MSSESELLRLWNKIKGCNACPRERRYIPWAFPERWSDKGFLGDCTVTIPELGRTIKIMFVSFRPSTVARRWGEFPSPGSKSFENVKNYYLCLKEYGFENAHLTDILKCQKPVKAGVIPLELRNCVTRFLSKEIEMVRPNLIVTLGRRASDLMSCIQAWLKTDIPQVQLLHYAQRKRENIRKFRKALEELRYLGLKILVLHQEGVTIQGIAKELDISSSKVRKLLQKFQL